MLIERRGRDFIAHEEVIEFEVQTTIKSGEIRNSLFTATDAADIPDALTKQMIGIFGSEIDFHRDLRRGDSFSLDYETLTHRGQTIRSGRILAATVKTRQKLLQAYWFQPEHEEGGYYTADGTSLRKTFLLTPIEFRASVRAFPMPAFTRYCRPCAPTRVRTTRHRSAGTYWPWLMAESTRPKSERLRQADRPQASGHLLDRVRAPQRLCRKGARVRQGDTTGTVGQTGLASGPHLHDEFRVNDEQVDPLAIALPGATPLKDEQRVRFTASWLSLRTQLELAEQITLAAND